MRAMRLLRNFTIWALLLGEMGGVCPAADPVMFRGRAPSTLRRSNGAQLTGLLLELNARQVRFHAKGQRLPFIIKAEKVAVVQTASDTYTYDAATRAFVHKRTSDSFIRNVNSDVESARMAKMNSRRLKPGKRYEIDLRGTIALSGPLMWYQIRGVIKEITPEQAVILEIQPNEGEDSRLISCPAGTVRQIFLGHESECQHAHMVNGNLVVGYSDQKRFGEQYNYRYLSWWDECHGFGSGRGHVRGLDLFPQTSMGGMDAGTAEEVIEFWKSKGDKEACAIVYTWTDEDAKFMQEFDNKPEKPVLQRAFEAWQNATPEQKEFIKGVAVLGVSAAVAVQEFADKHGVQTEADMSEAGVPDDRSKQKTRAAPVVSAGTTLSGYVTYPGGHAAKNIKLTFYANGLLGGYESVITDGRGRYELKAMKNVNYVIPGAFDGKRKDFSPALGLGRNDFTLERSSN